MTTHLLEADLTLVPPELHDLARAALEARDPQGFLMSNRLDVFLVFQNVRQLKAREMYEKTLLEALTSPRRNLAHVPLDTLHLLLYLADRTKLLAAGDPSPGPGPFTVYRGVAGKGRARRVRGGISWTASRSEAIWFATRFPFLRLPDPAVFEMTVAASAVYACWNERKEQEFIVIPTPSTRVRRLSAAEMPGPADQRTSIEVTTP